MLLTFREWSANYNAVAGTNPQPIAQCNQTTDSDKCKAERINAYKQHTKDQYFSHINVEHNTVVAINFVPLNT